MSSIFWEGILFFCNFLRCSCKQSCMQSVLKKDYWSSVYDNLLSPSCGWISEFLYVIQAQHLHLTVYIHTHLIDICMEHKYTIGTYTDNCVQQALHSSKNTGLTIGINDCDSLLSDECIDLLPDSRINTFHVIVNCLLIVYSHWANWS